MNEAKQPAWRFEPQNLYGKKIDGEQICNTFGYLSIGTMPVFELNTFIEHKPELLREVAMKACAADAMYEALKLARAWLEGWASADRELATIESAIAKAEGR